MSDQSTENTVATHPSLPSLDFGEIDITPPSLRRQSRPQSKPIGHEFESIPQLPSSFSDASSLLDSSSRISDIAIKSISSRSQAKIHDIRQCLMEYYVDWKWEFLASFIVIACPFVIVATLYPNAGKPLPEWPFQISINTLLSIYGLVFKTCLIFIVTSCIGQLQWFWFSSRRPLYDIVCYDRATRGPWGSIQLLFSEHIRNPLTGLGAMILIAAVAIDPLIQQLVLPYDCEVATPNIEATLPRTFQFDKIHSKMTDPTSGLPIKSAIYAPEDWMTWQCTTGNCTFSDTYGTLAYCSSCEEISDKLIFETTCYDGNAKTNVTSGTEYCDGVLDSITTTKFLMGDSWITMTISDVTSNVDPAVGKVLHYATCLRVQWSWIAFPATLAVLSLVCLVAVITVMDRQQVPVWKSSPLALIMRGSNTEFWCKPTADAMEEMSKEITVILIKGSDPQIQVVRKDFGLVDMAHRGRNNSNQTLKDNVPERSVSRYPRCYAG
ncbi:hypothetical protein EAE99_009498 [Botrytis elliptica]|nr:hypothetical protein EAE99_009498 [Botrytis elliptica]